MEEVFTGVTEQVLHELSAKLQEKTNLTLEGHEGQLVLHGFTIAYIYQAQEETLRIRLIKKPWLVPEALIRSQIDAFFAGPGASFARYRTARS